MNSRSSIRATLSSDRPKATSPRTSGSVVCSDRRAMSALGRTKDGGGQLGLVLTVGFRKDGIGFSRGLGVSKPSGEEPIVFQRPSMYRLRADGPGKAANQCYRHTTCGLLFCFGLCPNRKVRCSWQWECVVKSLDRSVGLSAVYLHANCFFKSVIVLTTGKSGGRPIRSICHGVWDFDGYGV
jgi:hypothetical protein